MKRSKYSKVVNPQFQKGDPRRNEPPLNSVKRIGVNWRQETGPMFEECLIPDFRTKIGPDYDRGEVPFLFS